jgi:hypothetical protein
MESKESGMLVRGEVKDIKYIGNRYIVMTLNNERPVVYEQRK